MFRSIRWSLLFWYSITLSLVISAFGAILYYRLRHSMLAEVDAELRAHAQAMSGALESHANGQFELELSDEYVKYFKQPGKDAPYYAIWDPKGVLIDQQPDPTAVIPRPQAAGAFERGYKREIVVTGMGHTLVLVGCGTHERHDHLEQFLGNVLGAAGAALFLALLGGWFLASRALAPIQRISETASRISASSLSSRIPEEETESELGRLARVLNLTFARLQEAFDRQTRFTADASHELRTPLSIVMSHLELALRKERSAAEYKEAIETALKASERMKAVVEGLLVLARADAGTLSLAKERIDLRKVVEETLTFLGPLATQRRIEVRAVIQPQEVMGDRDRLREVVTNLLTNAIRYNREGGSVDVGLSREGAQVVLTVADTGVGIPASEQPHVFERFFRVDKVRSREQGGSGLGLSIAKWVVEAHGGTIGFTSREGEGTTFTVHIPAAPPGASGLA